MAHYRLQTREPISSVLRVPDEPRKFGTNAITFYANPVQTKSTHKRKFSNAIHKLIPSIHLHLHGLPKPSPHLSDYSLPMRPFNAHKTAFVSASVLPKILIELCILIY